MRKITNKFGLPEILVKAVQMDTHKLLGDISASALCDSPQIRILKKKHGTEEDVSDMLYALEGTANHHVLQRANPAGIKRDQFLDVADILEKIGKPNGLKVANWLKLYAEKNYPINLKYVLEQTVVTTIDGMEISGTPDYFDAETGLLYDYKRESVYAFIYPEAKQKHFAKMNVYAHMLREKGFEVKGAVIVAMFRDWSKNGLMKNKDYPPRRIMVYDIPLLSHEQQSAVMIERVRLHKQAEMGNIPDCTGVERWATTDIWAAKVQGKSRALNGALFDNAAAAQTFKSNNAHTYPTLFIEHRPGENRRCDSFCPVREFCEQRKRYVNTEEKK